MGRLYRYGAVVGAWRGTEAWETVASELRGYRQHGFGNVITEDIVRFAAIKALAQAGIDSGQMHTERPHPKLKGSRVDLVVGQPPVALIEFKYPREPNEKNAAWTMTLGEVLKDLYRLAAFPGRTDRLFVYVETSRLRHYMAGAARRHGFDLDSKHVALRPAMAAGLPETAARIIGRELAAHEVTARRVVLLDIDDGLRLAVYDVDALDGMSDPDAGT